MAKDKRKIAISIGVCSLAVVALLAVYVLIFRKGKKGSASDTTTANTHDTSSAATIAPGSRGAGVKQLQRYLNDKLVSHYLVRSDFPVDKNGARITQLDVDGIYGEKTESVCQWWFGSTTIKTDQLC